MAVIRCQNGHFYDDQKFSKCPHCGIFTNMEQSDEKTVAMKPAKTDDDQKTVAKSHGLFGMFQKTVALKNIVEETKDDDVKTVGIYSASKGNDYVTGWLVCVSGPEKGRDYRIRHGFNHVGRSYEMSICITEDQAVSRERHCSLVYDDKSNSFSVVPGSGTLTYVNGEILNEPKKVVTGDQIGIGESTLEFIAFCREGRTWEKE